MDADAGYGNNGGFDGDDCIARILFKYILTQEAVFIIAGNVGHKMQRWAQRATAYFRRPSELAVASSLRRWAKAIIRA